MKKKILSVFFIILAVSLAFTAFAGCVKPLSDDEKEVVGKYQLIEIKIDDESISVDVYDEYTIELKSDRKCIIVRKGLDENYYENNATWERKESGEVEITIKIGRSKAYQKYEYKLGYLIGTNTFVNDSGDVEVYSRFIKLPSSN